MRASAGEPETLQTAVDQVVALVPACSAAGLFEKDHAGEVHTTAATGDIVHQADRLQVELGEGPCLEALEEGSILVSDDLAVEKRWARWATAAHDQLGIGSILSVPLYDGDGHGALNLYATGAAAFDRFDRAVALALATQISDAVASVRRDDQLRGAGERRTVIGQATGILMERFGLDAKQAFATLVRASQHTNTRLYDIAERLAMTKRIPDSIHGQEDQS